MNEKAHDARIKLKQSIRWLPADTETPISLYMKIVGEKEGILLESAEVDGRWGRFSILACDMCFNISCQNGSLSIQITDSRFKDLMIHEGKPFIEGLRALMNDISISTDLNGYELPPITRALYGYLGFGMVSVFNPHLSRTVPIDEAECNLALPATVFVFDHLYNRLCQLSLKEPPSFEELNFNFNTNYNQQYASYDINKINSSPEKEGYKNFVKEIVDQLGKGEAIQVVPSVRFTIPFAGDPFVLYRRLRRINASPYMFYMRFPHITLLGSSPEIMVRCTKNTLLAAPIAGTRKRGKTEIEDQALASELLGDPKERAEHVMLVDLGRNDLGKIAKPGTVKVEKYMDVEKFSHVMHLTSRVAAELNKADETGRALDALDVLIATFPAGTVSGAPKFRAMEIIRKLEGMSRGPYAGCIGWFGLDKDSVNLDTGITIRSLWVKDGQLNWQAGGGIVHDSDPETEWNEVWNKSAIMRMILCQEDENYVPSHR